MLALYMYIIHYNCAAVNINLYFPDARFRPIRKYAAASRFRYPQNVYGMRVKLHRDRPVYVSGFPLRDLYFFPADIVIRINAVAV